MKDPKPLLESALDDFEVVLLRSARWDRGSERARQRVFSALGVIGAEISASALAAASTSSLGAAAASAHAAGTSSSITAGMIAKWLGIGIAAGVFVGAGAVAVQPRPSSAPSAAIASGDGVTLPGETGASRSGPVELAAPSAAASASRVSPRRYDESSAGPAPTVGSELPAAASSGSFPLESRDSTLNEELERLERVREALRSGDASRASAEMSVYERRFPKGALSREATLLAVETRLANGDDTGARARAERVFASEPNGPHARRLRELLDKGGMR